VATAESPRSARLATGQDLGALAARALPLVILVALIALWEGVVRFFDVPLYLVPAPSLIAQEIVRRLPMLLNHTWVTTYETVLAFMLSIVVGVPIGVAIVSWRIVDRTAYPLLVGSQAVPKVAIAPLLTIWLGFGLAPKVLVGLSVAFFPIVVGTVVGLKSVSPEMIYLGRSMGLTPLAMFLKIGLPQALPSIMGGLRVAISLAVVGAIVGEFTGADRGLGYLLMIAIGQLDTRLMFSALFFLVTLGVVLFTLVAWAERFIIPWQAARGSQGLTQATM
jgi:NitT/TauT family transport system permease protein